MKNEMSFLLWDRVVCLVHLLFGRRSIPLRYSRNILSRNTFQVSETSLWRMDSAKEKQKASTKQVLLSTTTLTRASIQASKAKCLDILLSKSFRMKFEDYILSMLMKMVVC